MNPENDKTAFDWIRLGRDERKPRTPEWAGYCVSHLMPPVFEAYVKILHRIDANYENIDNPLSASEISILKIPPCTELKTFVESRRANSQGGRIRWKELAELMDVPFAPEICHEWYWKQQKEGCWPRFLYGPAEGVLNTEECAELVSTLGSITDSNECYFRFAEIPFIVTNKPLLFKGTLDEIGGFLREGTYQYSPEYWWPSDQTWCVCSDFDLMFTIVGGSRKLVSTLLSSSVLECLEMTPQMRIDSFAPMPKNL